MKTSSLQIGALLLLCIASTVYSTVSPLEEFVYRPDQGTTWNINQTIAGPGYTAYVLNFTSMNWLTSAQTSAPRWKHWLTICVPDYVSSSTGMLWIENGNNASAPQNPVHPIVDSMCKTSQSIVSILNQNPNQPIVFDNDGILRSEDAILALTWAKFIANDSLTDYIGQFAETKAAVRAMDVIQEFVRQHARPARVKNFVVGGASKRGWAAWLVAAVDPRIKAVIPVVMPILNLQLNSVNHYRSYGGWSFTYFDYLNNTLMAHLNGPGFDKLAKLIDPVHFIQHLTVPKYIVTTAGDQYFIPDSSSFFWSQLLGSKHQRIIPNTDHSMASRYSQMVSEITTYYNMIVNKERLPSFEWSVKDDPMTNTTTIVVSTDAACARSSPINVTMWTADTLSTVKRDWRYSLCRTAACLQNITWVQTPVAPVSEDLYVVTISAPPQGGWRGAFIELAYDSPYGPQKYTTEFFYAPYRFPYADCGQNCQNQPFPA
eukprot:gene2519-2878_t